jgi:hypothetical protein|tara:strand:- start:220 stop:462 length:243 start_codon:yes stop_codon:yes gene_type:complete
MVEYRKTNIADKKTGSRPVFFFLFCFVEWRVTRQFWIIAAPAAKPQPGKQTQQQHVTEPFLAVGRGLLRRPAKRTDPQNG